MEPVTPPATRWTGRAVVDLGIRHPRVVVAVVVGLSLVLAALTLRIETDTDPENMLRDDEPVRILNETLREDFGTGDMVALGIVEEGGVLTPEILGAAAVLVEDVSALDGVVPGGVFSFASATEVPAAPLDPEDVEEIARAVEENPLLADRVVSPDGTALGVFVTLESKSAADDVADAIDHLVEDDPVLSGTDHHLAGLPLAEEEFGADMFVQMALLAPLAGLLIFLLMLYFFRKLTLVLAAMAVAMASVIWTMGLLIGTGFEVHIMSSMIPIFLMPIAILDSIHVLSEFFDRYQHFHDRRATLHAVYRELFLPLTYTSLTTAVAFASLMLAPIPPVQVFGGFVALGVVAAWALTMVFVPAFVMLLDEQRLRRVLADPVESSNRILTGGLHWVRRVTTRFPRHVAALFVVVAAVAVPGVLRITVNDNPVRWFKSGVGVREATEHLNERFPGTYNASFVLEADGPGRLTDPATVAAVADLQERWDAIEVVGKTTSYVDVVDVAAPGASTSAEVEEALEAAEAEPRGQLVASLVTADRQRANVQVLLSNGDNRSMQQVVDATDEHLAAQPLPSGIRAEWAGETYLNLVWQDKMVTGMVEAFLGTLAVILVLMLLLFRSLRWAVLAMVPVIGAILVVYGVAGWIGKDYDMPMAVLSALVLGIGVDFGIHFVQRYRELHAEHGSPEVALREYFEEPARALTRNAVIIAVGFLPLFASSLVPYLIVGTFLASLMILSWGATLVLLPSLVLVTSRPVDTGPDARTPSTPVAPDPARSDG